MEDSGFRFRVHLVYDDVTKGMIQRENKLEEQSPWVNQTQSERNSEEGYKSDWD